MKTQVGSIVKTGERCPETGLWEVIENPSVEVHINVESFMPPYKGRSVSWKLKSDLG